MFDHIQKYSTLGNLIGSIIFFIPVLGFIAPRGLAPLVIIGGIVGILLFKIQSKSASRPIHWLNGYFIAILFCFCIWSFISIFWSINSWSASVGALKLTGNMIAGGLLFTIIRSLNEVEKKFALRWLFFGIIFVAGLLILEIYLGDPIYLILKNMSTEKTSTSDKAFWLNSVAVILAMLIWPLCIEKLNRNIRGKLNIETILFIFFGIGLVLLLLIQIRFSSGILAFCFGIFSAGFALVLKRRVAIIASTIIVCFSLVLPLAFKHVENPAKQINELISLPFSAQHRIAIWEFTADKVSQKPYLGWGFNASKLMPDGKNRLFSYTGQPYGEALPLHPHNAIMQVWLELGLPGIILYISLVVSIIMSIFDRNRSKFEAAAIFGQFSTIMVISNLSYGI